MRRRVSHGSAGGGLPGECDGAPCDAPLVFAARLRHGLNRASLGVAAQEVHPGVDVGRVALQDLFHQADGLDIFPPIHRGAQPQAGDGICHRDLRHALPLVFDADGFFRRCMEQGEVVIKREAHRRNPEAVLTEPMQQLHDERRGERLRQCHEIVDRVVGLGHLRHVGVGRQPGRAIHNQRLGKPPEVFNQDELQHARPGPELTDGQRRDALVTVQELQQLLAVQAAVAVAHQFKRQHVHAGLAVVFAGRDRRQRARVPARQVPANLRDLGDDQRKVVDEPVGGRRHKSSGPHVVGQRAIGGAQQAHVVFEPRERIARPASWIRIKEQAGRKNPGAVLNAVDAQQLGAQRWFHRRHAPEPFRWRRHGPPIASAFFRW